MISIERSRPQTSDGWRLDVRCYRHESAFDVTKPPLLFIPGYGMNSFILGYHPSDVSMVEYLASCGHEVWTANLRGQGDASTHGTKDIGFAQLALIDIPTVRDHVLEHSQTEHQRVVWIGCSLGASMLYAYLAHHPEDHAAWSMIAIGGPLRWNKVHPLLKVAFRSPKLASLIPFKGTRKLAQLALPVVRHIPDALSIYMNARRIDLSEPHMMTQTVDDPVPWLNLQIAHWIHQRELRVDGVTVSDVLSTIDDVPILCVIANKDGIVPPETALSVLDVMPAPHSEVIVAGDDRHWYAHADLFIGQDARRHVFEPMANWIDDFGWSHA